MARIPFDIKYRPQIESGEYKVITNKEQSARIICWDRSTTYWKIVALVLAPDGKTENPFTYDVNGNESYGCLHNHEFDLFIITPEPEEELEKEFQKYMSLADEGGYVLHRAGFTNQQAAYKLARHFAEWGAENKAQELRGEVAKVKTKIWQDGFDDGYVTAQKEQPEGDLKKLGEIARHIIAVKQNVEDMRLSEDEWLLLERIGYPHKLNARKED